MRTVTVLRSPKKQSGRARLFLRGLLFTATLFGIHAVAQGSVVCENYRETMSAVEYPEVARVCGLEGEVRIEFTLTTTGTVRNPSVVSSSHRVFNKPALDSLAKLKCASPDKDTRVAVPVDFRLADKETDQAIDPQLIAICLAKLDNGAALGATEIAQARKHALARALMSPTTYEKGGRHEFVYRAFLLELAFSDAWLEFALKAEGEQVSSGELSPMAYAPFQSLIYDGVQRLSDDELLEFIPLHMLNESAGLPTGCVDFTHIDPKQAEQATSTLPLPVFERLFKLTFKVIEGSLNNRPMPPMSLALQDQATGAIVRILGSAAATDAALGELIKKSADEKASPLEECQVVRALYAGLDRLEPPLKAAAFRVLVRQAAEQSLPAAVSKP